MARELLNLTTDRFDGEYLRKKENKFFDHTVSYGTVGNTPCMTVGTIILVTKL